MPSCSRPLALRLLTGYQTTTLRLSCDHPIQPEFLARAGIPLELVQQLKEWDLKIPKIIRIGMTPEVAGGLDNAESVRVWREVMEKTQALAAALDQYLVTESDELKDLLERLPPQDWIDENIVRFREQLIRLNLIREYGWKVGKRFLDVHGTLPEEAAPLPVPIPKELQSEEERSAFASGFHTRSALELPTGLDFRPLAKELAELERKLGIRP